MLPRRKSLPRSWDPRPLLSDLRRSLRSKMASSIIRRRRGSKMAAATTDDIQDKKMRMRDSRPKSFHLGAHPGEALGLKPGQPLSVEDIQALKATLQGGRPATFHPGMLSKNKSTEGGKPARVKEITAKLRPYLDSGEMPPVSVYKELKDRLLNEDVSKRLSEVFQLISVSLVRTDANTTSLRLRFGTLENAHALWTHSALGLLEPLIETVLTSPMRSNVGMEDLRMRVDVEEEDYLPVFETLSEGDYFVRVKDDKSGLSSQEDIQTRPGEVLRVVQADDVAQLKVESLGGERTGSILRENVAHVGPFQDDMLKRCTEKRREPESVPVVNAANLHAMVPGTYVVEEGFEATAGDEISAPSGTRVAVAVEDRPGPLIDWCLVRCLEDSKQGFLPRSCLKLEEADAVDPTSPALEKADPFGSLASGNNGGTHSIGAVSRAVLDRYRQTHYDRGLKSCADAAVASLKALTSRETTRSDSRRSSLDDLAVGQENKDGGEIRSGTTAILTPAANAGHSQTGATGSSEEENNEESAAEDNGPSTASEGDKENIHYLRSILKSAEENEDLNAVSDNLNKLLHVLIREDGEDSLAESAQCAKKLQEIGAKLEDPKTQAAAEIFLAQISKQKGDFTNTVVKFGLKNSHVPSNSNLVRKFCQSSLQVIPRSATPFPSRHASRFFNMAHFYKTRVNAATQTDCSLFGAGNMRIRPGSSERDPSNANNFWALAQAAVQHHVDPIWRGMLAVTRPTELPDLGMGVGTASMSADIEAAVGFNLTLVGPLVDHYIMQLGQGMSRRLRPRFHTGLAVFSINVPPTLWRHLEALLTGYGGTATRQYCVSRAGLRSVRVTIPDIATAQRIWSPARRDGTNYLCRRHFQRARHIGQDGQIHYTSTFQGYSAVVVSSLTPVVVTSHLRTGITTCSFFRQNYTEGGLAINTSLQATLNSADAVLH